MKSKLINKIKKVSIFKVNTIDKKKKIQRNFRKVKILFRAKKQKKEMEKNIQLVAQKVLKSLNSYLRNSRKKKSLI